MKLLICNITCVLACTSSALVWADNQSEFVFSGELGAGVVHNSALSVDELDDVSKQSDSGQQLKGTIQGQWNINQQAKLSSGYSYSQQNYNQYSQYDLALHQLNADASYKFSQIELGMRFDAANARLAGDTFLDFQQVSVYLGKFLQPNTFLRTSVKSKDKSFTNLTERDARGVGASADLFHFVNGAQTMWMLGLSTEKENAQDNQFDYWAAGINSKVTHKFNVFGLDSKVGLSWRYLKKDYDTVQVTELQGTSEIERDENKQVLQVNWELTLLEGLSVKTEFEHGDYQSQIESLTYQQNVASLGVNYTF